MSPPSRARSGESVHREAILSAACAELAEHGFEKASTNRIVERSGASKGVLYYHFDDKRDLFAAALRHAVQQATLAIGPPRSFADARDFWDALGELYERIGRFAAREPVFSGLLKAALSVGAGAAVRAGAGALVDENATRIRVALRELLERGARIGAVRDDLPLDLLASLMVGTGEIHDRFALERIEQLAEEDLVGSTRRLLALHMRIAAPLALACEREADAHGESAGSR